MIPVAKPFLGEEEALAAREAILSGWVTQGPRVKEFEDAFASYAGAKHACAVSNCTTALHLALLAVGVTPGDVVVTVSHSFIATANSVRHCGAEPVFVDIEPDTFNMSPARLERLLAEECEHTDRGLFYKKALHLASGESPLVHYKSGRPGRVAAVMPAHQLGMPCDINGILRIAKKYNLPVVEDAACAAGSEILNDGRWEKIGRPRADVACFSFHPRKVITTGDGGMLTTDNPRYDGLFRLLRQHGMSVPDTARHGAKQVIIEKYLVTGFNYRMTDIQAAVGKVQLGRLAEMVRERRKIAALYGERLSDIGWLKPPIETDYARGNYQSYPVRLHEDAPISRDALMQKFLEAGISTRPGVMNAHEEAPYGGGSLYSLPESAKARKEIILLPIFNNFPDGHVEEITAFLRKA